MKVIIKIFVKIELDQLRKTIPQGEDIFNL
jgi:hypothetical protein